MSSNAQALWFMLDQLTTQAESVTFLDAIRLLQQAQLVSEFPRQLWPNWHELIIAPHTTDGARTLLQDYMRRVMQQTTAQRQLSKQVIRFHASGKTLRLSIGQRTQVALNARPLAGWTWQIQSYPPCIDMQLPTQNDMRTTTFELTAIDVGQGDLSCVEVPTPTPRYRPNTTTKMTPSVASQQPRTFILNVIVEPNTATETLDP